jgi:hypothetical protein
MLCGNSQDNPRINPTATKALWKLILKITQEMAKLYQYWAVLTFLWEPAGSGSYILLWEPDRFSDRLWGGAGAGENPPGYQDF